jgi:hypothetical protein
MHASDWRRPGLKASASEHFALNSAGIALCGMVLFGPQTAFSGFGLQF